ncbi:MAG: hypothetical protein MJ252_20745 [archaeon]|nr:hypothetical protein [archaeon]
MEQDKNINYPKFIELPDVPETELTDEKIAAYLQKLKPVNQWNVSFDAMNSLRCINKKNPAVIKKAIGELLPLLEKLSNSIRSALAMLCLIFLREILILFNMESINDYGPIYEIVRIVAHMSSTTKGFIKNDARKLLLETVKYPKYQTFHFVILLIELMKNDSAIICDNCFEAFESFKQYVEFNEKTADINVWIKFATEMEALYNKKKERYSKKCAKIFEWINAKYGAEKLLTFMTGINLKEKYELFQKCVVENTKTSTQGISLKEFKKLQKGKSTNADNPFRRKNPQNPFGSQSVIPDPNNAQLGNNPNPGNNPSANPSENNQGGNKPKTGEEPDVEMK